MMIGLIPLLLMAYQSVQSTNFYRLQLHGNNTQGYYYVQLYFGRPSQMQTLLIDTGSSLTVFPCSNCKYCDNERLASLYNSERSFTSSIVKCKSLADVCQRRCYRNQENCQFSSSYMDGTSLVGDILDDQVSFVNDDKDIFHAYFGCTQFQKETTNVKANGIMGLGPQPSENLLYKWYSASPQRSAEFTVCLGENGGFLQIGKNPDSLQYDAIFKYKRTRYTYSLPEITSIKYGKLNILDQNAYRYREFILDTGSTISYFPDAMFSKVVAMNEQLCNRNKNCMVHKDLLGTGCFLYRFPKQSEYDNVREFDEKFPTFTLATEQGNQYSWYPRHQFKIYEEIRDNYYVVCMLVRSSSRQGDMYLMGDSFLREKIITYNIKQETISIVDNQTCAYQPYSPSEYTFFRELFESTSIFIDQYGLYIGLLAAVILFILRKQLGAVVSRTTNRFKKKTSSKNLNQEHTRNQQNQVSIVQTSIDNSLETSQKSDIQITKIKSSET